VIELHTGQNIVFRQRCKLRFLTIFCIMIVSCLILGGCANINIGFNFNKDGTITAIQDMTTASPIAKDKIDEQKVDVQKQGYAIKETSNGFTATKTYKDITELVNGGADIWNPNEKHNGVQFKKGLLYDYYSLDLYLQGRKEKIPKANNQAQIPGYFSPKVKGSIWQYLEAKKQAEEEADAMNQIQDEATQSAINSLKMDLTLNFPYTVDVSNADQMQNDGKTAIWNLKPALFDNKDMEIQAKFKIYHETTLIVLGIIGGIVLICGIVLLVLGIVKKDTVKGKWLIITAVCLFSFVIVTAGYAKYDISNPPTFSSSDRIIGKNVKDSKGNLLADTWKNKPDAEKNVIADIKETLKSYGVNYEILAASKRDDDGFLVLVKDNENYYIGAYSAKDSQIAWTNYSAKTLNFMDNFQTFSSGKKYYNPLIFEMDVPVHKQNSSQNNSQAGLDDALGVWNDAHTHHHIPVYALFKVDDNGNVIPGMINSGNGAHPSHYQGHLKEQINVNLVNIFLTHMDSLRIDIKSKNVVLPN